MKGKVIQRVFSFAAFLVYVVVLWHPSSLVEFVEALASAATVYFLVAGVFSSGKLSEFFYKVSEVFLFVFASLLSYDLSGDFFWAIVWFAVALWKARNAIRLYGKWRSVNE